MSRIELLDVSIRDGNQSLWGALALDTAQMLSIAPVLDRIGFRALDFTSSTHMGIAVRNHRENPWERIRLMHAAMANTPLQFIGTGLRFISWDLAQPDFMQLVYDRLVANGIGRFAVMDPMNDAAALRQSAQMIRKAGAGEIVVALTFTSSDVHDDAFYATLAGELAQCPYVDRLYIKDPSGLLTAERAGTLIPALRARMGTMPLELHSHCTIGLSGRSYMVAAELGVQVLQVALGPLANGASLPDAGRVLHNLRELGHTVDIDDRLLGIAADYFTRLSRAENLPAGRPQDYDAAYLRHQLAGGVLSTTRRQLAELSLEHRFADLIQEVIRVRAELGYPIMVTPFTQMVCSQALYNLIGRERYANVPDQVIRYALGKFGRPSAALDPNVLDRVLSQARAREIAGEGATPELAELRRRFAPGLDDDTFLLRATMPSGQVDAMLAAGPALRRYNPATRPLLKLLRELAKRPPLADLVVAKPNFRLALRRRPTPASGALTGVASAEVADE
jgi:oxaloacetate decarboxylase alpha subunit